MEAEGRNGEEWIVAKLMGRDFNRGMRKEAGPNELAFDEVCLRSVTHSAAFTFMKFFILILLWGLLAGCGKSRSITPQGRLDKAIKELAAASNEEEKFYALDDAAKQSFELGKVENARMYATNLLSMAQKLPKDWNYGNAIQDGNLVLGRVALKEGRTEEAKKYLLEAGKSPGSPQMDSFGPNMSLAQDLLAKGEREVVLQYFELCRKFWEMGQAQLDQWTKDVKAGNPPDFGANLIY